MLGIARGRVRVRFGGKQGKLFRLKPGDVVILPAGTGHEAIRATKDLIIRPILVCSSNFCRVGDLVLSDDHVLPTRKCS